MHPLTDTEVYQETHYYPFGMTMEGEWQNIVNGPENNYLYNGKELNSDFGLDWSDYGARYYDAAIGRWGQVDLLAEVYYTTSGYAYVLNNPIGLIDPDGRSSEKPNDWFRNKKTRKFEYLEGKGVDDEVEGYDYWGKSLPYNPKYNVPTPTKKNAGVEIIGNDNVSSTVSAVELATDNSKGVAGGAANIATKILGPLLTGLEATQIIIDVTTGTEEKSKAGIQNGAKFTTEVGLSSIAGPAIGIPATVLINNSKNPASVAHPENITRAAGAFESSRNAVSGMVQSRIRANETQRVKLDSLRARKKRMRGGSKRNDNFDWLKKKN